MRSSFSLLLLVLIGVFAWITSVSLQMHMMFRTDIGGLNAYQISAFLAWGMMNIIGIFYLFIGTAEKWMEED